MKSLVRFILESGKDHTGEYSFKQTVRYLLTERIPEAMNNARVKDLFSFLKWGMSSKKHNEFNRENPIDWFQELCYNVDAPDGGFMFDVDACYQDDVVERDAQGKYEFTNKAARIFNDMYAHVKKHGLGGTGAAGAAKAAIKALKAKFDNDHQEFLFMLDGSLTGDWGEAGSIDVEDMGYDVKAIRKALGLRKGQGLDKLGIDVEDDVNDNDWKNEYNKLMRLLGANPKAAEAVLAASEIEY